jgi:hypothetical protein
MTDDAPFEPPPEPPRCPSCLALVEPDQEFCLECGARLEPAAGDRGGRGPRNRWLIAGIAALLLVGGFVIAWGFTRDDSSKVAASSLSSGTKVTTPGVSTPSISTIDQTGTSVPTITGSSTATTTVTVTETSGSTSTGTSADCGGQPSGPDTDSWPNGRDGWMAILSSKPTTDYTFADFCARLKRAEAQGYTNLGIVDSTDYVSLRPGFWVLYEGPFNTRQEAAAAAAAASGDWPGAYPREVNDSL